MNKVKSKQDDIQFVLFQTRRLQELIADLHTCCKDRINHDAKKFDLPPTELKCLILFDRHKYLTGGEIAKALEVAKSRITVITGDLEKKGLIQRTPDPNDARTKLISLTPTGQLKVQEISEHVFSLHRCLLEQIDPVKRPDIIASLEILRSAMHSVKAQKLNNISEAIES